jgi:hypothetical protein
MVEILLIGLFLGAFGTAVKKHDRDTGNFIVGTGFIFAILGAPFYLLIDLIAFVLGIFITKD